MNKNAIIIFIAFVVVLMVAAFGRGTGVPDETPDGGTVSNAEVEAIRSRITEFGDRMKSVSLLLPSDELGKAFDMEYGGYVAPELLAEWKASPELALGRSVSSPWPKSIYVASVTPRGAGLYQVEGSVIEVASQDGGEQPAATYPVVFIVEKSELNNDWQIVGAKKGPYDNMPPRVSVQGMAECLPHRDTSGPQTLECAFGILADGGKRYAIDTRLMASYPVDFPTGERLRVEGVLMPRNEENRRAWEIYAIDGIIGVTTIERL